ncbi:HNH endonuclease [Nocardioides mangrovicus]|uniref:HNH endonuclease n=1 Tax=Nocardioides mangrovicus TaxID=2478913 RepID=A0A3L8P8M7_9ACTN|nr:HNH endonuclease [Nocardioides mangrovicus]
MTAAAATLVLVPLNAPAAHAAARADSSYSASLSTAISHIPVAAEDRTGYERTKFTIWVDADGNGCDTRDEVLIAEATQAPTVGSSCSLNGGEWYSSYDGVTTTDASDFDIDHLVPLAEAWDSGASAWTAQHREDYANDLGDDRTLAAVSASSNRSKGDRDPAEWLPADDDCAYVEHWVAVKIRWGLTQDSAEKAAISDQAASCGNPTITVSVVSE